MFSNRAYGHHQLGQFFHVEAEHVQLLVNRYEAGEKRQFQSLVLQDLGLKPLYLKSFSIFINIF